MIYFVPLERFAREPHLAEIAMLRYNRLCLLLLPILVAGFTCFFLFRQQQGREDIILVVGIVSFGLLYLILKPLQYINQRIVIAFSQLTFVEMYSPNLLKITQCIDVINVATWFKANCAGDIYLGSMYDPMSGDRIIMASFDDEHDYMLARLKYS